MMRVSHAIAATGFPALAACGTLEDLAQQDVVQTTGPNGRTAYVVECDQFGRGIADCFIAAGELCTTGYDVIDRVARTINETDIDGNITSIEDNSLFIECK